MPLYKITIIEPADSLGRTHFQAIGPDGLGQNFFASLNWWLDQRGPNAMIDIRIDPSICDHEGADPCSECAVLATTVAANGFTRTRSPETPSTPLQERPDDHRGAFSCAAA
ncbi:MAG: hypothetical protein U0990_12695 [Candidatus Nanopelagicales bacterium]|nr:hypothetical protein [Candidatus Nanopelagicales bacterium]